MWPDFLSILSMSFLAKKHKKWKSSFHIVKCDVLWRSQCLKTQAPQWTNASFFPSVFRWLFVKNWWNIVRKGMKTVLRTKINKNAAKTAAARLYKNDTNAAMAPDWISLWELIQPIAHDLLAFLLGSESGSMLAGRFSCAVFSSNAISSSPCSRALLFCKIGIATFLK